MLVFQEFSIRIPYDFYRQFLHLWYPWDIWRMPSQGRLKHMHYSVVTLLHCDYTPYLHYVESYSLVYKVQHLGSSELSTGTFFNSSLVTLLPTYNIQQCHHLMMIERPAKSNYFIKLIQFFRCTHSTHKNQLSICSWAQLVWIWYKWLYCVCRRYMLSTFSVI